MIYDTEKLIATIDKLLDRSLNELELQLQTGRYDLAVMTSRVVLNLSHALAHLLDFSNEEGSGFDG